MTGYLDQIFNFTGKKLGTQEVSHRPHSTLCYKSGCFNSMRVTVLGAVTNAEMIKIQGLHLRNVDGYPANTWICKIEQNAVKCHG